MIGTERFEFRGVLTQEFTARGGDSNGFAAEQVSNFRYVLVGMHNEEHVLFKDRMILTGDVARSCGSGSEPVAAATHVW